jgi:hypothetical protein
LRTKLYGYVYFGNGILSTVKSNGAGGETTDFNHPDRLGTRTITNQQSGTNSEQATLPSGAALNTESTNTISHNCIKKQGFLTDKKFISRIETQKEFTVKIRVEFEVSFYFVWHIREFAGIALSNSNYTYLPGFLSRSVIKLPSSSR